MDLATTMNALSWEFYNRFYQVLVEYGIVYLPLLIFLYQNWLSEDIIGRDAAQTVVALTVKRMFVSVSTFFLMYYLAFVPSVPLSNINNLRSADPIPAYDSTFNQNIQAYGGQFLAHDVVIKVPLIWAGMELFIHSINQGFLAILPNTAGDVRGAMATAIKNSSIKTPFVRAQYEHFYRNCYSPAAGKFQFLTKQGDIVKDRWFFDVFNSDIDLEEYDWAGGSFYLETPGFYKPCDSGGDCYSSSSIPGGITTEFNGGQVSCKDLWETNGGLKENLMREFKLDDDIYQANNEMELRAYLQSNDNAIFIEFKKEVMGLFTNPINFIIGKGATIVAWLAEVLLEIITTVIVAFLPIGQAIIMLIFVVLLPIILLVSALRIDIFVGLLVYYFTFGFLTVIWAIAAFIDNNIMSIMTNSGNGNDHVSTIASEIFARFSLTAAMLSVAVALLYYQMTKKWFQLMNFAGAQGMEGAQSAMNESQGTIKQMGSAGKTISNKIKIK